MATLTLYCRASPESAWSRLNTAYGPRPLAERTLAHHRNAWAHTILPDHEFLIDDGWGWPAPVVAGVEPAEQRVETRIPEPAL